MPQEKRIYLWQKAYSTKHKWILEMAEYRTGAGLLIADQ